MIPYLDPLRILLSLISIGYSLSILIEYYSGEDQYRILSITSSCIVSSVLFWFGEVLFPIRSFGKGKERWQIQTMCTMAALIQGLLGWGILVHKWEDKPQDSEN